MNATDAYVSMADVYAALMLRGLPLKEILEAVGEKAVDKDALVKKLTEGKNTREDRLRLLTKTVEGLACIKEPYEVPDEDCDACPYETGCCALDIATDAYKLLKEQQDGETFPECLECGKRIESVEILMFMHDGSDRWEKVPFVYDSYTDGVSIMTNRNWTGYEDQKDWSAAVRCPYCKKHPFDKKAGMEIYEPVEAVMWTKKRKLLQYGDQDTLMPAT